MVKAPVLIGVSVYVQSTLQEVPKGPDRYGDFSLHSGRPARFVSVAKDAVTGMPDLDRASTSHVERKNGSLRQWCNRHGLNALSHKPLALLINAAFRHYPRVDAAALIAT
jgi:hypothetical protein